MASKRHLRRSSCDGKVRHPDKGAALGVARIMRKKHPGEMYHAYKCKFCGMYHVGHTGRLHRARVR